MGLSFEQVVLGGLATDKGLYIPDTIPEFTQEKIESMRGMSYSDLAYEVISAFVSADDIPSDTLKDIVNRSFATFRSPGKEQLNQDKGLQKKNKGLQTLCYLSRGYTVSKAAQLLDPGAVSWSHLRVQRCSIAISWKCLRVFLEGRKDPKINHHLRRHIR
jgi:hypothetical protein